jgi:hypothetical protein
LGCGTKSLLANAGVIVAEIKKVRTLFMPFLSEQNSKCLAPLKAKGEVPLFLVQIAIIVPWSTILRHRRN